MKKLSLLVAASVLLLNLCNAETAIDRFSDESKTQIARTYIQRLVEGDLTGLTAELDSTLQSANVLGQFRQMQTYLPAEKPAVTQLVGYQTHTQVSRFTQYNVTYQFGYASKWVLVNVAWKELPSGDRRIMGFNVNPMTQSLQEANAFTFTRAGALQYAMFFATIAIPLFILVTTIVCARTRPLKKKWLWIIFILVGVMKFSVNWTTGAAHFSLIHFQLFGAGMMSSSIYSPRIFSISLPLGAILFWILRRELQSKATQALAIPPATNQITPTQAD